MSATAEGINVLPFYLVADVSYSMRGAKLDTLNGLMPSLRDELVRNPIVGDMARFGVIDFASDASVPLPLTDLRSVEHLPALEARGGTVYTAALSQLQRQIEADYAQLRADGYAVKRPTAVFLSDGEPINDHDWKRAFEDLTFYDAETDQGFRLFPNLIPVGIGDARRKVILDLRHRKTGDVRMPALFSSDGDPAVMIAELIPLLIRSIVNSTTAEASGGGQGRAAIAMASTLATADGFDIELD